jgi:hypothetical protein
LGCSQPKTSPADEFSRAPSYPVRLDWSQTEERESGKAKAESFQAGVFKISSESENETQRFDPQSNRKCLTAIKFR